MKETSHVSKGNFTARAEDWIDMRIELNTKEIAQRIQQENWRRGIATTEAWTRHISTEIARHIAKRGIEHLLTLKDVDGMNNLYAFFQLFFSFFPFPQNTIAGLVNILLLETFVGGDLVSYRIFGLGKEEMKRDSRY